MDATKIFSIPKSFFTCIRLFGVKKSFSLPLMVSSNTKISAGKGSIVIPNGKRVSIGFGGSAGVRGGTAKY